MRPCTGGGGVKRQDELIINKEDIYDFTGGVFLGHDWFCEDRSQATFGNHTV